MLISVLGFVRKHLLLLSCALCLGLALLECVLQVQESSRVREIAESVVRQAGASSDRERVIALRDYIRREVTFIDAPLEQRPWLRATAVETLRDHKGYCGEVTRTFICLARSLDIPAQRVNLYGRKNHVVAEVDFGPEGTFLVDCQEPPSIPSLTRLDDVLRQGDYEDYSTLNVRRAGLSWLVSRLKLRIGWLTDLTENPHAMKAAAWLLLLALLLAAKAGRCSLRWFLRRRGWIHRSNVPALHEALGLPRSNGTPSDLPPAVLDAPPSHAPHS